MTVAFNNVNDNGIFDRISLADPDTGKIIDRIDWGTVKTEPASIADVTPLSLHLEFPDMKSPFGIQIFGFATEQEMQDQQPKDMESISALCENQLSCITYFESLQVADAALKSVDQIK
mmetsp:Transcript_11527/g.17383  ORF Transcript_11527/g.17383 Transcript_11527/m.17383 type:complete len:118 (+) Transcript_11527:332-685(+)